VDFGPVRRQMLRVLRQLERQQDTGTARRQP